MRSGAIPQESCQAQAGIASAAPQGWTYNPSAWPQRLPIIGIALLNGAIATYLAVCQGWFHGQAWEPFFGNGTQRVLTSSVSQALPVSDAALGALAYILEAVACLLGASVRWRTKPWLVLSFGLLVLPLCIVSIVLMILQPLVVHAWCSLCLLMLAGMLVIVPLALDEVIAALQFLSHAHHDGQSLWHRCAQGGAQPEQDRRAAPSSDFAVMWRGYRPTWSLLVCLAIGIVLLFLPSAQTDTWGTADSLYITGAFVIVISSLAFAEVARAVRFLLLPCGFWLFVIAPWTLLGATNTTKYLELLAGALLMVLCVLRGTIREHYGAWDRWIV